MYGIIKVGAIDCSSEEELCEEFGIFASQLPQLLLFTEAYSDTGERFEGKKDWNSMATFATRKMQNFVSIVTPQNFDQIAEREPKRHKVLVFSEKRSTPALIKAFSKKYLDKLVFGEIRRDSAPQLEVEFGITKFPTIVVLTQGADAESRAHVAYEGEYQADQL